MEDAKKQERPADVNSMCQKCITDCPGTTCKVWTGCVYRKTEQEAKQ